MAAEKKQLMEGGAQQAQWVPVLVRILSAPIRIRIDSPKNFAGNLKIFVENLKANLPIIPLLATAITVLAYVAQESWAWMNSWALLVGFGSALGIWFLITLIWGANTSAETMNTRECNVLKQQLDKMRARLDTHCTNGGDSSAEKLRQQASAEARKQLDAGDAELRERSVNWALGTGYINVWNRVHRAEEALLFLVPLEEVVDGALIDDLRLDDSGIAEHEQLQRQLRVALAMIDPYATAFLEDKQPSPGAHQAPPPSNSGSTGSNAPETRIGNSGSTGSDAPVTLANSPAMRVRAALAAESDALTKLGLDPAMRARAVLAGVRTAINTFRDEARDGLVRARTDLLRDIGYTGSVTYLLVVLLVAWMIPEWHLFAAMAYYLVGTVTGLFGRLYRQRQVDKVMESYGLNHARTMLASLLSGLAAIGGVVLIAMLPAIVAPVTGAFVPVSGAAATFANAFDLSKFQFGLVIAAVFGLTPRLVVDRLQQDANRYAVDLSKSAVATRSPDPR